MEVVAQDLAVVALVQCLHHLDATDDNAEGREQALVEAHRIAGELLACGGGSLGADKVAQVKAALENELLARVEPR